MLVSYRNFLPFIFMDLPPFNIILNYENRSLRDPATKICDKKNP